MEIKLLLTFIGGLIVAYVTFLNSERKIAIENITQERAKWRDKIRDLALEIHKAIMDEDESKLSELKNRISLHLNPTDREDIEILNLIHSNSNDKEKHAEHFTKCVAYLLKHDWERAKLESKPAFKRLIFLHSREPETTDSPKTIVKLLYKVFYHPKRLSCSDKNQN